MKSTLVASSIRLLVLACALAPACGRSTLDEAFVDGAPEDDDDGFGDDDDSGGRGSGRGGRNGNGGADPASGGASSGRGGTFGGSDATGGRGGAGGASTTGGVGGASTNGGAPTAGTPGGGAAGTSGSGNRGGTEATGGVAGSGGSSTGGMGGETMGFIRCGELLCEPRVSVCCRGGGEFACGATLDDCPRLGLACTGDSTCDAGLVCCLRFSRATCEPTCEPGDPGPGRGFRLCDSSVECAADQTCISGPRGLTWCADNYP